MVCVAEGGVPYRPGGLAACVRVRVRVRVCACVCVCVKGAYPMAMPFL